MHHTVAQGHQGHASGGPGGRRRRVGYRPLAMQPQADLVYDVGLYDGTDTAYYLSRGYRVVAVEANPQMVARAQERFAESIDAGRLTIVPVGIGPAVGTAQF